MTAPMPDVSPLAFTLSRPAAVVAELAVKVSRFPVVVITPVETTLATVPVVAIAATLMIVPANCPVEAMSRIVPLVVPPVSTEDEESLTRLPVSATTEVVCAICRMVPVVSATSAMFRWLAVAPDLNVMAFTPPAITSMVSSAERSIPVS